MKYIISEEELEELLLSRKPTATRDEKQYKILSQILVKNLCSSKQPVELVAEIKTVDKVTPFVEVESFMNKVTKEIYYNLDIGNNIKIYIQKVKKGKQCQ